MSAWRKHIKPIAIGGGVLAGTILLALAVTAGGCRSRLFTKKSVRRPAPAAEAAPADDERTDQNVHRRELDELLSIE